MEDKEGGANSTNASNQASDKTSPSEETSNGKPVGNDCKTASDDAGAADHKSTLPPMNCSRKLELRRPKPLSPLVIGTNITDANTAIQSKDSDAPKSTFAAVDPMDSNTPDKADVASNSHQSEVKEVMGKSGKLFISTPVKELSSNPFDFNKSENNHDEIPSAKGNTTDDTLEKKSLPTSTSFPRNNFDKQSTADTSPPVKIPEASADKPKIGMNFQRRCDSPDITSSQPVYPGSRKASIMSVDSAFRSSQKRKSTDSFAGNFWRRKLSQLFVPPSQEELQNCGKDSPEAERFDAEKKKLRSEQKKSSKSREEKRRDSYDEDNLDVLEILIEDESYSSSSAESSDEDAQLLPSKGVATPEIRSQMNKTDLTEMNTKENEITPYDTICSNRSAYFKQYYLGQNSDSKTPRKTVTYRNSSMASLIKEKKSEKKEEKKKEEQQYCLIGTSILLFLLIVIFVSLAFFFYNKYIMSVFIFNRIRIISSNRTLEVLTVEDRVSDRVPLVKIRLGIGIPSKVRSIDCTDYLEYLIGQEEDVQNLQRRLKRFADDPENKTDTRLPVDAVESISHDIDLDIIDWQNVNPKFHMENNLNDNTIDGIKNIKDPLQSEREYAEEFFRKIHGIPGSVDVDICGIPARKEETLDLFSEMHCIYYQNMARLQLTNRPPLENVDCFSVHWESDNYDVPMKDCFIMDNADTGAWWGLGDVTNGAIPLLKLDKLNGAPIFTGEIQKHKIGGVIRRVFFSTNNVLISLPLNANTIFSVNASSTVKGEFCLSSPIDPDFYNRETQEKPVLDYTVCTGSAIQDLLKNMQEIECMNEVEYATSKWHRAVHNMPTRGDLYKPLPIVNSSVTDKVIERFKCPMYRPWLPHDDVRIDQKDVIDYAEKIASTTQDVCGYILLPVTWQAKVGNLEFDESRFPDPKVLQESLLRKGLKLALTVSALVETNSAVFKLGSLNDLLIRQINSTLPILVSASPGISAGVLDFTNPNTMNYFEEKLQILKEKYDIDNFHIKPETTLALPPYRHQHNPNQNPDYALGKFVETVSRINAPISTEAVILPVPAPTFVTAKNGDASWEMLEMLPNRIMSISAVGGNLVDSGVVGGWSPQPGHIPDRELFIRWLQASTFLPAVQVSVLPSMYNENVQNIARSLKSIRNDVVLPLFAQGIKESIDNGYPLITSLAMSFPKDPKSLEISDQWMVKNKLLIAPVLRRGGKSRDIYLPPGIWRDAIYDKLYKGKRWLRNYAAPIHRIPYFISLKLQGGGKKKNKQSVL